MSLFTCEVNYKKALRIMHIGPPFTKRAGVLPQDLVKSRSREVECYDYYIALKVDGHPAEVPYNFRTIRKV